MPEQLTSFQQQTQQPPTDANSSQQPSKDDLIARASAVKLDNQTQPAQTQSSEEFDFKQIEAIKDPIAKEQAMLAYKSFQKGFNNKFQELAEQRKTLDKQLNDISNWSPEKVQSLLNNTSFVQSAQAILGTTQAKPSGVTDEEFSNLSETEKQELVSMRSKINQFEQQNLRLQREKEHESLKSKYSEAYDSKSVENLFQDLGTGKIQAGMEHIFKVLDYDNAVKRAYQLGMQDRNSNNMEKVNAVSSIGNGVNVSSDKPIKGDKESGGEFLGRLIQWNKTNLRK